MSQERDIRLYMFLRLSMLFSVLVSVILYQRSGVLPAEIVVKTYFITFFTFLVTMAFIFLYEKARHVSYFLTSQVAYDILFTTVLTFYTGPYDSVYTVFYLFNIVFAAILFRGTGSLLAALLSGMLYVFVAWVNSEHISSEKYFSMLTTLTAFVAIALLAGQLVEELRKSRQRINRLEQLNEEIVDCLDSGLLGLDAAGAVQKVNRTAQNMLGLSSAAVAIGRPLPEVLPGLGEMFYGNQVRELMILGRMRRILVTRVDLPESHSMILMKDLSEIFDLEERVRRQERLAGVGRLAAGVAHEIRNPIASISGAAQMLASPSADEDERNRLAQIMVRESERVDRLVAQLLRFAKPTVAPKEVVNLSEMLTDGIESVRARPDFQKLGVDITVEVEGSLSIRGNRDELSEVISNLLVNALQALAEKGNGAKRLRIEGHRRKDFVEILVADNGPGIPREFRGRIFDPFFTTKATGTGLGLAQVDKIVRDHDGQVDVETEEGKGTALKIRLPA